MVLLAAQAFAQRIVDPAGEAIYRQGRLPSGSPVSAKREPDLQISGADAACSNCHRRSGLGELEGSIRIPPIAGVKLYSARADDGLDMPDSGTLHASRDPYTDVTLARAIREGVAADGRPLNYLMPHYALSDADMATLIQYLKSMTPSNSPGVTASVLHFATIITPDVDAVKRSGMLDVLEHFFADKNASVLAERPRIRSSGKMVKAERRWQLHVWELTGPAPSWEAQLRVRLDREPVLAVIGGAGGRTWAPIHHFCEQAGLPCLFPNVDLPVVAERDFYSLYFSRGVLLEADLMAHQIREEESARAARRVVQIFRQDDIGVEAAQEFRNAAPELQCVDRPLRSGDGKRQLAAALRDVNVGDALILWLRPVDFASLASMPAPKSKVFMSGLMGGLGLSPLPAAWRPVTTLAYPFDLPDKRRVRLDYPLGWFRISGIPVVDEKMQADTWLAGILLSETLNHMGDSLVRDYLVERMEGMLEHELVTAYYPRLAMAPNQRFASKGGYLVRFADAASPRLAADSEWIIP